MLSRSPASWRRRRSMSTVSAAVPLRRARRLRARGSPVGGGSVGASPVDHGDGGARPHRLGFADDADDVGRRAAGEAIRQAAGEQLVEQDAERVDVRRRGHRLAADLLRARVFRRHQLQPRRGRRQRLPAELRVQQLGDAEVEQLGRAVGRHQHVGRLDVAVDDQVLVRVLDGGADVAEERQPGRGVEPVRVAVVDDRLPFDVLHGEVGPAVRRAAAVEEAGDERMLEAGQDLPLVTEPPHDAVGVHPALEHLDRDALLERVVVADAEVDGAHAAVADLANEAVGARGGRPGRRRARTSAQRSCGRRAGRSLTRWYTERRWYRSLGTSLHHHRRREGMAFTRREFGRVALAGAPAIGALLRGNLAAAAVGRLNRRCRNGPACRCGLNVPYSLGTGNNIAAEDSAEARGGPRRRLPRAARPAGRALPRIADDPRARPRPRRRRRRGATGRASRRSRRPRSGRGAWRLRPAS